MRLGLALDIHLECRFRPAAALEIRVRGRDAALISTGEDNLIWQTALRVAAGRRRASMPPIELEIANDIPLGKGLGSSAAALTAGVVIASGCAGSRLGRANACCTKRRASKGIRTTSPPACWDRLSPAPSIRRASRARCGMEIHPHYGVAVVVPDFVLPTAEARRVLPETYSREDTIFNVQRSALLIAALTSGVDQRVSGGAGGSSASAVSFCAGAGPRGNRRAAHARVCWAAR